MSPILTQRSLRRTFAKRSTVYLPTIPARAYVLDDQSALRKHINIFVDGIAVRYRRRLTDLVGPDSRIHVYQDLSGG